MTSAPLPQPAGGRRMVAMIQKLFMPALLLVTVLVVAVGLWLEHNHEQTRLRRAARKAREDAELRRPRR